MNHKFLFLIVMTAVVLAGCSMGAMDHSQHGQSANESTKIERNEKGEKVFTIEAKEAHWMYNDTLMDNAWTYNGKLPGEELRVEEGDEVVIKFKNSLTEPSAIHLHGLPIPNEMDGVPGVTQNAVLPGETFEYKFTANIPGTFWYHSHQDGAKQVDKGLYGAFIVEPKDKKEYTLDKVIVLDEWSSMSAQGEMDHAAMGHGSNREPGSHNDTHAESMNEMYDTFLINGKAAPAIEGVEVKEGDIVKLRFINAGLFTQIISIPRHTFKVTHLDGQEVNEPQELSDTSIRIAPAERYDVEIIMNNPGAYGITIFAEENQKLIATLPIVYNGAKGSGLQVAKKDNPIFDLTSYGKAKESSYGKVTKEYKLDISTKDNNETFLINGKNMPNHEVFEVEKGDVVKVTMKNDTDVDHPMHLHGQFFQVIAKNGQPISGSPIIKDTLNVRPNETYEVVFLADNPGNWMFHCHELHHASGGMVSEVSYKGYSSSFVPDPSVNNKPE